MSPFPQPSLPPPDCPVAKFAASQTQAARSTRWLPAHDLASASPATRSMRAHAAGRAFRELVTEHDK